MHSFDTKVEYSDSDDMSDPTEVTGVKSVDPEDSTITKTPTHHLRSSGAIKTRRAGMIEEGDLSLMMLFDAAVYAALKTIFLARSNKYWRVTYFDGSTLTGEGFISSLPSPTAPDDDEVTNGMKISPTGGWTFAEAP